MRFPVSSFLPQIIVQKKDPMLFYFPCMKSPKGEVETVLTTVFGVFA
jgi:hypothetical protein